jgi:hypothetical protein
MLLAQDAFAKAGLSTPSRMVAITQEGSALFAVAKKQEWRRVFPMWDWIGGRTSVTSAVGLLPAELAGIDTASLLSGARDMDHAEAAARATALGGQPSRASRRILVHPRGWMRRPRDGRASVLRSAPAPLAIPPAIGDGVRRKAL